MPRDVILLKIHVILSEMKNQNIGYPGSSAMAL